MKVPEQNQPAQLCDDCSQLEASRIHRDTTLRHFHIFTIPLMDRPATDFPEGWPPGIEVTACVARDRKRCNTEAALAAQEHDTELIRRQAWKWVQEEDQRRIQGDTPLAD